MSAKPVDWQVFVSHATVDKWIAEVICEKIADVGAKPWIDHRDLAGGDEIPAEIRRQIKWSRELVVLLTPQSVKREWVIAEVGAAWGMRSDYRIVPILYHVTADEIPSIIRNRKAFELNDLDHYLSELRKRAAK